MVCNFDSKELMSQAKAASFNDFLAVVRSVISLLNIEQLAQNSERVRTRIAFLPASRTAIIVGDIHGDLESLAYILEDSGFIRDAKEEKKVQLIFLGDYGDRGPASPETLYAVLKLKEIFPQEVILMRGNHEGPEDLLPGPHDLPGQLNQKYGEKSGAKLYAELRMLFDHFYLAVLIDELYVLIHGGVPSKAVSRDDLAYAYWKHPKESLLEDMLWSDPEEGLEGVRPSPRGAGKLFGPDITKKFLKKINVKMLIRSHEPCEEGFRINHNGKILTLFSTNKAPYNNKHGAYLQIDLSKQIGNAEQLKQYIKKF